MQASWYIIHPIISRFMLPSSAATATDVAIAVLFSFFHCLRFSPSYLSIIPSIDQYNSANIYSDQSERPDFVFVSEAESSDTRDWITGKFDGNFRHRNIRTTSNVISVVDVVVVVPSCCPRESVQNSVQHPVKSQSKSFSTLTFSLLVPSKGRSFSSLTPPSFLKQLRWRLRSCFLRSALGSPSRFRGPMALWMIGWGKTRTFC